VKAACDAVKFGAEAGLKASIVEATKALDAERREREHAESKVRVQLEASEKRGKECREDLSDFHEKLTNLNQAVTTEAATRDAAFRCTDAEWRAGVAEATAHAETQLAGARAALGDRCEALANEHRALADSCADCFGRAERGLEEQARKFVCEIARICDEVIPRVEGGVEHVRMNVEQKAAKLESAQLELSEKTARQLAELDGGFSAKIETLREDVGCWKKRLECEFLERCEKVAAENSEKLGLLKAEFVNDLSAEREKRSEDFGGLNGKVDAVCARLKEDFGGKFAELSGTLGDAVGEVARAQTAAAGEVTVLVEALKKESADFVEAYAVSKEAFKAGVLECAAECGLSARGLVADEARKREDGLAAAAAAVASKDASLAAKLDAEVKKMEEKRLADRALAAKGIADVREVLECEFREKLAMQEQNFRNSQPGHAVLSPIATP